MPYIPKKATKRPWVVERKPFENFNISPELKRFYQSQKWRRLRLLKLSKNPLCEACEPRGIVKPAAHIDHVQPIKTGSEPWALQIENLRALCLSCHSRKTGRSGADQKKASG